MSFIASLGFIQKTGLNYFTLFFLLVFITIGLFTFWAVQRFPLHPVSFDEQFLYLKRHGIENKVSFNKIGMLTITNTRGGQTGDLKFYEDNLASSIRFLIDLDPPTEKNLQEFKQLVRAKKIDFWIEVRGVFSSREL